MLTVLSRSCDLLSAKHPREDRINILQLTLQIECPLHLLPRNPARDLLVLEDQLPEVLTRLPSVHGVALYQAISVLTRDSMLR